MVKLAFVVLALTAITVQADRSKGAQHRIRRSSSAIDAPPPAPVFHTHHWSGFQKSSDGKQAGVFSGAAAAAEGGSRASGQAFSLAAATSDDSGSLLGTASQVKTGHNDQPDKLESRFGGDDVPVFGSSSHAQSQSGYHAGGNGGFHSGQFGGNLGQSGFQSGGYKESRYSYQKGGHDSFVKGGYSGGLGGGSQAQSQAQAQSSAGSGFGSDYGKFSSGHRNQENSEKITFNGPPSALGTGRPQYQSGYSGPGYQRGDGGFTNSNSGANTGSNAIGSSGQGYGSAHSFDSSQGFNTGAASNAIGSSESNADGTGNIPSQGFNTEQKGTNLGLKGYNSGYPGYDSGHQGYSTGQSALNGALNLASQGLQISPPSSGCSTCGKGNYALSNAKSKNGDAVAVSIGG